MQPRVALQIYCVKGIATLSQTDIPVGPRPEGSNLDHRVDLPQLSAVQEFSMSTGIDGAAGQRLLELAGCDFTCIRLPISLSNNGTFPTKLTKQMFEYLLQNRETLLIVLENYSGQISIHTPAHKLFASKFKLVLKERRSWKPLKALTVFTDASSTSCRSVMTWKDPQTQQWETDVKYVEGSPQIAELATVVRAFERFAEPFSLITDLACVA